MDIRNVKDDVPRRDDLFNHFPDARAKLLRRRAGDEVLHLDRNQPLVEKSSWNLIFNKTERKMLDDRLFSDARLAHEKRVRIHRARQGLDQFFIFFGMPHEESRLRLPREVREIGAIAVEHRRWPRRPCPIHHAMPDPAPQDRRESS